jgi:hypothetical protein
VCFNGPRRGGGYAHADRHPGRRIVSLQTSQALLHAPQPGAWPTKSDGKPLTDSFGRVPFAHPALAGLAGLTGEAKGAVLDKARLAGLAERYGLDKVTRWAPKRVCRLPKLPLGARALPPLTAANTARRIISKPLV